MSTQEEIRRYGSGKFYTMLDAYVYGVSLDGCDEELDDSEGFGWYGRLSLNFSPEIDADLNATERDYLRTRVGAIIEENSQGFVTILYFASKAKLDQRWKELEKEYSEFDKEER